MAEDTGSVQSSVEKSSVVRRSWELMLNDDEIRFRRLNDGVTYLGWVIKDLSEVDTQGVSGVVRQLESCRKWLVELLEEKKNERSA